MHHGKKGVSLGSRAVLRVYSAFCALGLYLHSYSVISDVLCQRGSLFTIRYSVVVCNREIGIERRGRLDRVADASGEMFGQIEFMMG